MFYCVSGRGFQKIYFTGGMGVVSSNKGDKSKKPKGEKVKDPDQIGKLADCVLEAMTKELDDESEPFEYYSSHLRSRLLADGQLFRERFVKGYRVLLGILGANNNQKEN